MRHQKSYHMRDQVRHRVRDIMRARPSTAEESPPLWPAAALVVTALTLANILVVAPSP